MKYTKKERNELYKKALVYGEQDDASPYWMCVWLSRAIYGRESHMPIDVDDFPEILHHKPNETFSGLSWFDPTNKKPRLAIMKQAIEDTNEVD